MTLREDKETEAYVMDHAVARDRLSKLRDIGTEPPEFRSLMQELGRISGYEIVDEWLDTQQVEVETPFGVYPTESFDGGDRVVLVDVLRAATPLVEGLSEAIPDGRRGVVSASRMEEEDRSPGNERSGFPVEIDYMKVPEISGNNTVILADPMLATGSTVDAVLGELRSEYKGNPDIISLSVVSSPEGISRVSEKYPDISLLTVSVDEGLNDDGYIVPGLGDAGDRAFGTG